MASLNKATLIGHIGADPELKMTNTNGVPVVNLRVATNEGWTDAQGQKHENTTWHTVVCYRNLAQVVAQYMKKGRQVYVEGRLQTREYLGKAIDANGNEIKYPDGSNVMVKKYATEIVAWNVQFLGANPMNAYNQGMQAAMAGATPTPPVVNGAANPAAAAATFVTAPAAANPAVAPVVATPVPGV